MTKKTEYRLMDYLTKGFVIVYGIALLLGMGGFPILKAQGILL